MGESASVSDRPGLSEDGVRERNLSRSEAAEVAEPRALGGAGKSSSKLTSVLRSSASVRTCDNAR